MFFSELWSCICICLKHHQCTSGIGNTKGVKSLLSLAGILFALIYISSTFVKSTTVKNFTGKKQKIILHC